MTDPCPEALEIARQVADSWRADGRLGQLESHIAPAIQALIEQRDKLKGRVDVLARRETVLEAIAAIVASYGEGEL